MEAPVFKNIVCATDGSEHALAVAHAVLGHEPLTLLHVWNPPAVVLADAFGTESASGGPSTFELERITLERAHAIVREGEELARQRGFVVEGRVERNRRAVWRTILDVAQDLDADSIVIGTHGTTAVQSALLGSVSNAVVHHSDRPVLVVPMPGADDRNRTR
jgi:nucleotide-binding universal stress UspA family protein